MSMGPSTFCVDTERVSKRGSASRVSQLHSVDEPQRIRPLKEGGVTGVGGYPVFF